MGSYSKGDIDTSDIAVVGLACRFPGGASNSTKFWDLLYERKSAYSEVPQSRYNAKAFHHPGGDKLNTLSCTGGHFLEQDASAFDAPFFNITAHEAKAMDPTARMLLEVTYEALENAGLPIENLTGSDTSCYVGCFTRDYHEMLMRDAETSPMYAGTGTGFSLLSNRVSWFYDFRGPSMTLDTACSSSLVGLHLACQGLRAGESKIAVVSGANLILSPDLAMFLSNLHMLSKEGLSKSFAEGVTGYGRGEGIATVILKPLADALRDGDSIRAVIRGSGINQDGHTTGITLPNSDAQASLIRSTYRSAGLDFSQTSYFEAHGTGTAVGDPLELSAVAKTLGKGRQPGNELLVGSVKSNIGHLEGAAGLAGFIKCVLMLETGIILPNIHFDKPNRRIPFENWKIRVPTSAIPWPSDGLRRVSVNSFGYGGTNAHVILDDAGHHLAELGIRVDHIRNALVQEYGKKVPKHRLFIFSARDDAALDRMRMQYLHYLELIEFKNTLKDAATESAYMDSLSYTLSNRRSKFDWKACVAASTVVDLKNALSASKFASTRSSTTPRIAFVFTGQGAQWARMGIELLQYPVFRASVLAADRYLKGTLGSEWSATEELERDAGATNIQLARFSQPICTILQVALVDLFTSWNIKPVGVVGHSSGEIGAAYSFGAISREDAWKISYWRGKLCSELATEAPELKGAMMAVGLSSNDAEKYIATVTKGKLVVACVNSPSSVTISGDEAAIDELLENLNSDGVFCRKLKVENAYHSHHMGIIADRYRDRISDISSRTLPPEGNMRMASSVTGTLATYADLGPDYWVRNLVSPVLFSDAVQTLSKDTTQRRRRAARTTEVTFDILLEVGPHAALKGPLRQIMQQQEIKNIPYESVLMRGEAATKAAVAAAGALYIRGVPVSISDVNDLQTEPKALLDLPSYPWNHSLKYWSESRLSKNYRFREHGRHDLVGALTPTSSELEPRWRHFLRPTENPWIRDHVVQSSILYPAAGILAMPLEAIQQIADKEKQIESIQLRDVRITKAMVVPDDQLGVECFLQLRHQRTGSSGASAGWWEFSVSSCHEDQDVEENAFGSIKVNYKSDESGPWATGKSLLHAALKDEYESSKRLCTRKIAPENFYKRTEEAGLAYGPCFQGLTNISSGNGRACCTIAIPDTKGVMPSSIESGHLIHPTTLDIIFHSLFAGLGAEELEFQNAAVPISFDSLTLSMDLPSGAGAQFKGFCQTTRAGPREVVADVYMSDATWDEPKVQIKGIRCKELPRTDVSSLSDGAAKAPFGTLLWKPDITLLNPASLEEYITSGSIAKPATNGTGQGAIIYLAAHKNPDLSILQIGATGTDLPASVLSTLQHTPTATPNFSNYTLADADKPKLEAAESSLQDWGSLLAFITLGSAFDLQELQETSFDVIIVDTGSCDSTKREDLFRNVQALLSETGYLFVLNVRTDQYCRSWNATETKLKLHPFEEASQNALFLATNPTIEERDGDPIYVLQPHNTTARAAEICDAVVSSLASKGLEARSVEWTQSLAEMKGKRLVSLLELEKPLLADISPEDYDILKSVVLQNPQLLWVSIGEDPVMDAALGYLRALKNENLNLDVRYLHLEDKTVRTPEDLAKTITKIATVRNGDREFVEIDGRLCINRWVSDEGLSRMILNDQTAGSPEYMAIGEAQTGLELNAGSLDHLDSFFFTIDTDSSSELAADEVAIEVKAIAIKDRDATSVKEISGIVKSVGNGGSNLKLGDRVCATGTGPYRTIFKTKERLCQQIPDEVTFEEAASWPLTYGAAYLGLIQTGRLQPGQSVLIRAAASPIGQAAIRIAQAYGATIFATVETNEESSLLKESGIPQDHILNDGDQQLAAAIATLSQGGGCDVILNNSTSKIGESWRRFWDSISSFGILVNLQDAAASSDSSLATLPSRRGASFSTIDMDLIVRENPSLMADIFQGLSSFLAKHPIKPIGPPSVFSADKVVEAFASLDNQGSAILSFNQQDQIPVSTGTLNPLCLDPNATYILVGGLGGLGRSLARLLIAKGARHLVFLSRSGPSSPNAKSMTDELTSLGATSRIYACDVSDSTAVQAAIHQCSQDMPPIRGAIQSAAVLNDSIYDNMTHALWQGAVKPKIQGSWNLHTALPKDLDFFVMLSSISGVVGNRSQANYAAGNTFQDALAHYRRKRGLRAVSIDLGLMLGIGLIAERGGGTNLRKSEAVGLDESEFHAIVTAAMKGGFGRSQMPTQLVTGLPTGGILKRSGLEMPFYYEDPRFSLLRKTGLQDVADEEGDGGAGAEGDSLQAQLTQATSIQEAGRAISAALAARLAKGLQTAAENIDVEKPLHSYGVDSLMAVETRTWIMREVKADVSLFDVLSGASIAALAMKIAGLSKLVPDGLE
ncbi:putative polyketide synthase [Mytilinidion resinicola]|uniref:Polyketide synthase n=1 Tax=Mytilinidion resinicola TaxID=574789 RepID=A0A6A6YSX5_9PEZI|nr:putative polyketide synthase [Mytilinidion resinicola]KAF2811619.1 putative polyketide synthase [Mytilinidion resinicola]